MCNSHEHDEQVYVLLTGFDIYSTFPEFLKLKNFLIVGFYEQVTFVLNKVADAYGVINALKEDNVDIYALFENDLPDIYMEGRK